MKKILTFENLAAVAGAASPLEQRLDVAPASEVSEVKNCFLNVWDELRAEFTAEQLRAPKSTDLPKIKSNIRKTINNSELSNAYKRLLIKDVEDAKTSIALLGKINQYLLQY